MRKCDANPQTTRTPILKGYQIDHNYLRPREALDGETRADKVGMKVKVKWSGLFRMQPAPSNQSS